MVAKATNIRSVKTDLRLGVCAHPLLYWSPHAYSLARAYCLLPKAASIRYALIARTGAHNTHTLTCMDLRCDECYWSNHESISSFVPKLDHTRVHTLLCFLSWYIVHFGRSNCWFWFWGGEDIFGRKFNVITSGINLTFFCPRKYVIVEEIEIKNNDLLLDLLGSTKPKDAVQSNKVDNRK